MGLVLVCGCATTTSQLNQDFARRIQILPLPGHEQLRPPRPVDQVAVYASPQLRNPPLVDVAVIRGGGAMGPLGETSDATVELAVLRERAAALGCDGLLVTSNQLGYGAVKLGGWFAVCQVVPTATADRRP
jgi:hypothetical protein